MQVTETLNEGLKRGYSIKLTAAELDKKVNEKLQEAQPDVEMKGFRKGKVPLALLKRQFGQRILGEAMQETIDGAMSKHFEDSGDRPALQPNIEMQNGEKWKVLRMRFSIAENVRTPSDSLLSTSRASQLPYGEKSKICYFPLFFIDFPYFPVFSYFHPCGWPLF